MKKATAIGRLAFRVEGTNWNAYWAPMDTMVDAVYLGSLKMKLLNYGPLKEKFMLLMQEAVTYVIEDLDHGKVEGWEAKPAPEHERTK